jgi:hypothetical protein
MAKTLETNPIVCELLQEHFIGYHSSSHSVRPIIPEFTDTKNFATGISNSLIRETSYINPINGNVEDKGGLISLRELFSNKEISSFRAPGLCWTPPHMEALKKLGIKYDFSSGIYNKFNSGNVLKFKGVKFFPSPKFIINSGKFSLHEELLNQISLKFLRNKTFCFIIHGYSFAATSYWDSLYFLSNPKELSKTKILNEKNITRKIIFFETFLKMLKKLEKLNLINMDINHNEIESIKIDGKKVDVKKTYLSSIKWCYDYFNYKPKYLLSHFFTYFNS